MIGKLSLVRFRVACIFLFVAAGAAGAQEAEQRATLRIRLPAGARLLVDGQETKQTGRIRLFTSPPLKAEKNYSYTLQWEFVEDGKAFKGEKTVRFRAGENVEVDLTREKVQETKEGRAEGKGQKPELDVPYVPTPQDVVDRMLEAAVLTDKDVLYDLGCGDGRIVATAARKYGCKAVGFDLDPQRVKEARDNVKRNGVEKLVTIEKKDIFKVDLEPATVVTLYLLPDVNVQLLPQLEKLKKGARILSHDFAIEGFEPASKFTMISKIDKRRHTVYVWFTPLKKKK